MLSLDSEKITIINQEKSPSNFLQGDNLFFNKEKSPKSSQLFKGISDNYDDSLNII